MLFFLKRAKIEAKKFLIISSLIIASGLITHLPDQLLITFKVSAVTNLPKFELYQANKHDLQSYWLEFFRLFLQVCRHNINGGDVDTDSLRLPKMA
jgi:hypothetical protein